MFQLLLHVLKDFLICDVHILLQLEDAAVDILTNSVKEDGLVVDMAVPEKPRSLIAYMQGWHNQVWDHAFLGFFKGKDAYSRSKTFSEQKLTDLAVKRAVYRYEFNSLLAVYCTSQFATMIVV